MKAQIRLITRADDAGSCRSANEAILEAVEAGTIKNVLFMAVGPEIEHAVELLGGRDDIAYGFHVCLNAEWEAVKWKPLTGAWILVDENGDFLPFPADTKAQIESALRGKTLPSSKSFYQDTHDLMAGIELEIKAQLRRLNALGLPVSYVDEHMGVGSIGFRSQIAALCRDNGLIDAHSSAGLPHVETSGDDFRDLEARLKRAMLDSYVWVTHPGKIAPDMERFWLKNQPPGEIARQRDAERRLLTGERLPELFAKWKVKPVRYDEV